MTLYMLLELDEYHLMYNLTDIIFQQEIDIKDHIENLNKQEGPFYYGDFENKKSLPKYKYKSIKVHKPTLNFISLSPLTNPKGIKNIEVESGLPH